MKNKFAFFIPLSILMFCICPSCSNEKSAIEPDPRSDTMIYNALEKAGILIP